MINDIRLNTHYIYTQISKSHWRQVMNFFKRFFLFVLMMPTMVLAWPIKPITIVVPLPPGGIADQIARPIANDMEKKFGVPVIVKNVPGGNHVVALKHVNESSDDHTFVLIETGYVSGAIPVELSNNFSANLIVGGVPVMLSSANHLPKDHLQMSIANKRAIIIGNTGTDLPHYLWIAGLTTRPNLIPISYKGGQPAMMDLAGGHIEYAVMSMTLTMQFIETGKIRALAIASKKRHPLIPHIPTYEEVGLRGEPGEVWWGFVSHTRVSKEAADIFAQAATDSLKNNPSIQKLIGTGLVISGFTDTAAKKFLDQEAIKFKKVKQLINQ